MYLYKPNVEKSCWLKGITRRLEMISTWQIIKLYREYAASLWWRTCTSIILISLCRLLIPVYHSDTKLKTISE